MSCPVPGNEAERLAELRDLCVLDGEPIPALDEICAVAARIANVPLVYVSLVDGSEQHIVAASSRQVKVRSPRSSALCAHTVASAAPLVVEDATHDQRFSDSPLVAEAGVRAYLGVPVMTRNGLAVGAICAIDYVPRQFSDDEIAKLSSLATITAAIFNSHRWACKLTCELRERKLREDDLWRAAHHDVLTGLPNLKRFRSFAGNLFGKADRDGPAALVLVDIDNFKSINDRWGHAFGDEYLCNVAERLQASIKSCDLVARIGGDEIAIALDLSGDRGNHLCAIIERIIRSLATIAEETGKAGLGRVSIGVAVAPAHGSTIDELYRKADMALYEVKAAGRDSYRIFDEGIATEHARNRKLKVEIGQAIEAGFFEPFFQPKMDLVTGTLSGFESLARWRHPSEGILRPAGFMPGLRDAQLARAISDVMLTKIACSLEQWDKLGIDPGLIAINASGYDLAHKDYANNLVAVFSQHGVQPSRIAVEVTECVVMGGASDMVATNLCELRRRGVSVELDDFGTGYASLQHLKQWPIDRLKIDRSFVRDLVRQSGDREIVRAIVKLAHALQIRVVAEGIETAAQRDLVASFGCDFGQGYLFGRPMAAADVPDFVRTLAEASDPSKPWPRSNCAA